MDKKKLIGHPSIGTSRALGLLLISFLFIMSCSPDLSDDEIPVAQFPDVVLSLSLPSNIDLARKGGIKLLNSEGVRGIIVYCEEVGKYHAYERTCSYRPNDACATVNVDPSNLFMIDPCCSSTFDFVTGMPIGGGAAWRPLRKYQTIANGSELTITQTIIQ